MNGEGSAVRSNFCDGRSRRAGRSISGMSVFGSTVTRSGIGDSLSFSRNWYRWTRNALRTRPRQEHPTVRRERSLTWPAADSRSLAGFGFLRQLL